MEKQDKQDGMRFQTIWDIRDARGLSKHEKQFLFIVESRGVMMCTWQRAADDMSFSRNLFFKTRDSLMDKGLLLAKRQMNGTTLYRVDEDAVKQFVPADSSIFDEETEWSHSLTENDVPSQGMTFPHRESDSLTGNDHSLSGESKSNYKKNIKKTMKSNTKKTAAGAARDFTRESHHSSLAINEEDFPLAENEYSSFEDEYYYSLDDSSFAEDEDSPFAINKEPLLAGA